MERYVNLKLVFPQNYTDRARGSFAKRLGTVVMLKQMSDVSIICMHVSSLQSESPRGSRQSSEYDRFSQNSGDTVCIST